MTVRSRKQVQQWTHAICQPCWNSRNSRKALKLADKKIERCCFCGKMAKAGIHVREDPNILNCQGNHEGANSEY